jgi:hypothetical protein
MEAESFMPGIRGGIEGRKETRGGSNACCSSRIVLGAVPDILSAHHPRLGLQVQKDSMEHRESGATWAPFVQEAYAHPALFAVIDRIWW